MRPDMFGVRLNRRARLRNAINDAMPVIDKAVEHYNLNEHYDRALSLVASGRPGRPSTCRRRARRSVTPMAEIHLVKVVSLLGVWLRQVPVSLR